MDALDTLIAARVTSPGTKTTNYPLIWNGSAWVNNAQLGTTAIQDNAIIDTKINAGSVTESKIANNAVTPGKIAPGTEGYVLSTVGGVTAWSAGSATTVARLFNPPDVTVTNTTVETAIMTFSVVGNSMGANGQVAFDLFCLYRNNSGSDKALTVGLTFGGTTFLKDTTVNIPTSANDRPMLIRGLVNNRGTTNSNRGSMELYIGGGDTGTNGSGGFALNNLVSGLMTSIDHTIDTTATQSLVVNVTHSAAHANTSVFVRHGSVVRGT